MNTFYEWLVKTSLVLLALLSPVQPIMIAVFVLILLDLFSGVWASIKRGKRVTSHGLRRTIGKTVAYQGAIIFAFVMETYLLQDLPAVKIVGGIIAITECKSFFENITAITGVDFLTLVLNKLQGKSLAEELEKKITE